MLPLIGAKTVEYFVGKTLDLFSTIIPVFKKDNIDLENIDFPKLLKNHYTEVINWSFDIPFIGLSQRKNVERSTIELNISSRISKYGKDENEIYFSEKELLYLKKNIIILGKPGAGKTTTVKRLINNFFSANVGPVPFTTPILIRLRELNNGGDIYSGILKIFNITTKKITTTFEEQLQKKDGGIYIKKTKITNLYIKDSEILVENFIVDFLESINSIIFLDGFDEISASEQSKILQDSKKLGLRLSSSKIILTSRTSAISNKVIDGFDIYEIQPLDKDDIKIISNKWLGDNNGFIDILYKKPYHELANRPIYLTLLLVLFEKTQLLPLSPFEIYREAIYLIVRDWDDGRDIVRLSKYANFNVRKKLDFLQEIAFYLTYQVKSNVFSSDLLFEIYKLIHNKYGLPKDEMRDVIAEIESHNGLISEAGYKTFEFSHLTLQEYLCAEYLISLPYSQNTIVYFFERPDPLAIAVCISKDSGLWLSNLLLNESLDITKRENEINFESSLSKLLTRLIDESPVFSPSLELGATMFFLISRFQLKEQLFDLICKFLFIPNVCSSINIFLNEFKIEKKHEMGVCVFNRDKAIKTQNFIKMPYYERINIFIWLKVENIMKENS